MHKNEEIISCTLVPHILTVLECSNFNLFKNRRNKPNPNQTKNILNVVLLKNDWLVLFLSKNPE